MPDAVFSKFLTEALKSASWIIKESIKDDEPEEIFFLEDQIIRAFGGGLNGAELLLREFEKLLKAHQSSKCYMPTDRHFQLLDRVIRLHCGLYNDGTWDPILRYKRKKIKELNLESILDVFFWDTDYDFSPELALEIINQRKGLSDTLDISSSALASSAGLPVDGLDLRMEEDNPTEPIDKGTLDYLWLGLEEDND